MRRNAVPSSTYFMSLVLKIARYDYCFWTYKNQTQTKKFRFYKLTFCMSEIENITENFLIFSIIGTGLPYKKRIIKFRRQPIIELQF